MPDAGGFHHRSTLKQQNKTFKSRHASKGAIKAKNKGRVGTVGPKASSSSALSSKKADRRNAAKIEQLKKRAELVANTRFFTGTNAPPKIVTVVPLCPDVDPLKTVVDLYSCLDLPSPTSPVGPVTLPVERFRQKLLLIPVSRSSLAGILDAARVSDFLIFLMSAAVEVDEFGARTLTAIKAQGVPNVLGAVQDSLNLIRTITGLRPKPIGWRDKHSYLVSEDVNFEVSENGLDKGVLKVTGFIRGASLSANRLMHIPDFGDFQIQKITSAPVSRNGQPSDPVVLQVPNNDLQESLISENTPDPMDAEQTWPTDEEIAEADERVAQMKNGKKTVRAPKGTSSYQAAWIVDDAGSQSGDADDDYDEDEDDEMRDEGEESDEEYQSAAEEDSDNEEVELESKVDDFDVDFNVADDERQYDEYLAEKKKKQEEDNEFPDEVDTPKDMPARVRFERYRGLKSLRSSPWDPYENLPLDYARIFQFENFKKAKAKVLRDSELADDHWEGVEAGQKVTVWIDAVPGDVMKSIRPSSPFVVFSLLQHEHKKTLASCLVHRIDHQAPLGVTGAAPPPAPPIVKSKDPLVVWCGFRKLVVQPVFSEPKGGPNGVHRFERYFHPARTVLANFYGPISFLNEPVLVFRESGPDDMAEGGDAPSLIATGHTVPPSPLRVIAKRILLTGHPFKINRRSCVVRYMFFSPQDIEYFKPVQLHTKMGLIGNIKESLGTHGYMKCVFGEQIKPQDTICMPLYKRVFPKWTTKLWVNGSCSDLGSSVWPQSDSANGMVTDE